MVERGELPARASVRRVRYVVARRARGRGPLRRERAVGARHAHRRGGVGLLRRRRVRPRRRGVRPRAVARRVPRAHADDVRRRVVGARYRDGRLAVVERCELPARSSVRCVRNVIALGAGGRGPRRHDLPVAPRNLHGSNGRGRRLLRRHERRLLREEQQRGGARGERQAHGAAPDERALPPGALQGERARVGAPPVEEPLDQASQNRGRFARTVWPHVPLCRATSPVPSSRQAGTAHALIRNPGINVKKIYLFVNDYGVTMEIVLRFGERLWGGTPTISPPPSGRDAEAPRGREGAEFRAKAPVPAQRRPTTSPPRSGGEAEAPRGREGTSSGAKAPNYLSPTEWGRCRGSARQRGR